MLGIFADRNGNGGLSLFTFDLKLSLSLSLITASESAFFPLCPWNQNFFSLAKPSLKPCLVFLSASSNF